MADDFEASLQVLRGFDTDITLEVIEIKICCFNKQKNSTPLYRSQIEKILLPLMNRFTVTPTDIRNEWCYLLLCYHFRISWYFVNQCCKTKQQLVLELFGL